jgi:hypothetical protein
MPRISIGDIGYLHEGTSIRMFKVTLPWNHPSNGLLGKPEPYDPIDSIQFTNTIEAHFDKVDHYSHFVTAKSRRRCRYHQVIRLPSQTLGGLTIEKQSFRLR